MGREKKVLNALLKGAAFSAFGMFLSKLMGYGYRIIVGRFIGPEAYGQLSIGLMILGFGKALSGGPMDNALKKFIPEYREDGDDGSVKGVVLSSLGISLILSVIVGTGFFLSAETLATEFFKSQGLTPIIKIFGLLTIVAAPYERILGTTLGFNTTRYKVFSRNLFQNTVKIAATVILVLLGWGLMGAVWAWVLATVLSTILSIYFLEKKLGPILTSEAETRWKTREVITYSYPLMLSGIISTVQGWADTAVIGYFMSDASVGIYNAAYPTAILVLLPARALGSLTLSSLSELGTESEESREKALKTITNWTFALTFPGFLLLMLFSRDVMNFLFGNQYLAASTALAILAFGNLTQATIGKLSSYMKSKDYTRIMLYNTVAVVTLNLVLNVYLVPRMGITGAAIATTASVILGQALILWETLRYENVNNLHPKMIKTVISGVTATLVTYVLVQLAFQATPYWALFPAAALFFTIHSLTFLKIGGLTEYDREIILTAARKAGLEEETGKLIKLLT